MLRDVVAFFFTCSSFIISLSAQTGLAHWSPPSPSSSSSHFQPPSSPSPPPPPSKQGRQAAKTRAAAALDGKRRRRRQRQVGCWVWAWLFAPSLAHAPVLMKGRRKDGGKCGIACTKHYEVEPEVSNVWVATPPLKWVANFFFRVGRESGSRQKKPFTQAIRNKFAVQWHVRTKRPSFTWTYYSGGPVLDVRVLFFQKSWTHIRREGRDENSFLRRSKCILFFSSLPKWEGPTNRVSHGQNLPASFPELPGSPPPPVLKYSPKPKLDSK